jgi:hypothetical protein
MAILRSTQKAQTIKKLAEMAPPGEQFLATVHCETGPSPWLGLVFDEIPFLGLIVTLMRKYYFVTLTSSHVVINTANRWTNRPGEVAYSFPRNAFPMTEIKRVTFWSSMFVMLPGTAKPTRLNINRYWRQELDALLAGLPAPQPVAGIPAQAPPPQVPSPVQDQR